MQYRHKSNLDCRILFYNLASEMTVLHLNYAELAQSVHVATILGLFDNRK